MKTTNMILAFLLVALVATFATFATAGEDSGEVRVKHRVKMMVAGGEGEEPVVVEAEDLEIGESRQFFTDSGKEVVLTRTEEGYDLEVDGEKIDVMGGHGHHAFKVGSGASKIFIHKSDEEHEGIEEEKHVFVHSGEGDFEWVSDGADVKVLHMGHTSALEHLRAKGILDELDEETRQKIVDVLEEIQPGAVRMKKVFVHVDEEIHEDHDE